MKINKKITALILAAAAALMSVRAAAEEYNEDWEQYVNENDVINATDSIECPYRVFYEENGATLRRYHAGKGINYKPFSVLYLGGITKKLYDGYMSGVQRNEPFSVDIVFSTDEGSLYLYSTCERKNGYAVQTPGAYVDSNYSIQITASLEPFEKDGEMIYAFTIYSEGIDEMLTEQVKKAKKIISASETCTVYVQAGDEVVDAYGHIGEYTAPVTSYSRTDISTATVRDIAKKQYKGLPIEPTLNIKDVLYRLTEGVDYTVEYKNNDAIGKAAVVIKGKGRYSGRITKTFDIVPKTVKLKVTEKDGKLTFKWANAGDVDKYILYRSTDGGKTYKKLGTVKAGNRKVTLTKKAGLYKIRSVKKTGGKNYYSAYSKPVEIKG